MSMSISRRNLILGAGASTLCKITPSVAERVIDHVARRGQPLFEGARATDKVLHAFCTGDYYQILDPIAAAEIDEGLVDAVPLRERAGTRLDDGVFDRLGAVVDAFHDSGVALADLHHRDVLIGTDDRPFPFPPPRPSPLPPGLNDRG